MRRTRSVLSILYSIYLGIALPVYTADKAIISSMNQTASNAQIERIQPDEFSGRTRAQERPQRITRRGAEGVVAISEDQYRTLVARASQEIDMVDQFRVTGIKGPSLKRPPTRRPRSTLEL